MLGTQGRRGALGHLEGVHEVFYQEEMPQLGGRRDHLGGDLLGQTFCLLPSQGQVHVQIGPERTKGCEVTQWVGGAQAERCGWDKGKKWSLGEGQVQRSKVKVRVRRGDQGLRLRG